MASTPFKFNTASSAFSLQKIKDNNPMFKGVIATNTAAYEIFIKLYWYWPLEDKVNQQPVVGTTVPSITIPVPALGTTTGAQIQYFRDGIQGGSGLGGSLWVAVTKLAADTDTTQVVAGDGIITILTDP